MKSPRVQPLDLKERPSQKRARSTITTEVATLAWDPHWGLFTALTVGVFVFLLRIPITGHMAGIAIDARIGGQHHQAAGAIAQAVALQYRKRLRTSAFPK
jgi:hypothetical protein